MRKLLFLILVLSVTAPAQQKGGVRASGGHTRNAASVGGGFLTSAPCTDASTVRCIDFTDSSVIPNVGSGAQGVFLNDTATGVLPTIDNTVKPANSSGSLKFTIHADYVDPGQFFFRFKGDNSVKFCNGAADGDEFFVRYNFRVDDGYIANDASAASGDGAKTIIVGAADGAGYTASSCTDLHLVTTNYSSAWKTPVEYHNCGSKFAPDNVGYQGIEPTSVALGGDKALQDAWGWLRSSFSEAPAWKMAANEWMTIQKHVKCGKDYSPDPEGSGLGALNSYNYHHDSTVELWLQHEGQPADNVISETGFDLVQHDTTYGSGSDAWHYGKGWLLPYETHRVAGTCVGCVEARAWYANVAVSKLRFPDYGVTTPNPAYNLTIVNDGTNNVLSWTNAAVAGGSAATSVEVQRMAGQTPDVWFSIGSFATLGTGGCSGLGNVFTCTDAGQAGAVKSYRVREVNASGASAWSNVASNVPGAVGDVRATNVSAGHVQVSFTITDPAPATGHIGVKRCAGDITACGYDLANYVDVTGCTALAVSARACDDTSVSNSTTYTYIAQAVNAAGSYKPHGQEFDGNSTWQGRARMSQVTTLAGGVTFAKGWKQMPTGSAGTTLITSGACPTTSTSSILGGTWMGGGGCTYVIKGWGSGAYSPAQKKLLFDGGGHADYGGNEVYAMTYATTTPTITRVFGPTLPGVADCAVGTYTADTGIGSLPRPSDCGSTESHTAPNSTHAYGGRTVVCAGCDASGTNSEQIVRFGGRDANRAGNGLNTAWIADTATYTWDQRDIHGPTHPWVCDTVCPSGGGADVAVFSQADKVVYIFGWVGGTVGMWNTSLTTSVTVGSTTVAANHYHNITTVATDGTEYWSGAIDDTHHLFVMFLNPPSGSQKLREVDLRAASTADFTWTGSGCPSDGGFIPGQAYPSAVWDSVVGKLVIAVQDSATIWEYNTTTHNCTGTAYSAVAGSSTPSASDGSGLFGRWQRVGDGLWVQLPSSNGPGYWLCRKDAGCSPD